MGRLHTATLGGRAHGDGLGQLAGSCIRHAQPTLALPSPIIAVVITMIGATLVTLLMTTARLSLLLPPCEFGT
jgi:hypothetical protein